MELLEPFLVSGAGSSVLGEIKMFFQKLITSWKSAGVLVRLRSRGRKIGFELFQRMGPALG